jgi:hypothetical protein
MAGICGDRDAVLAFGRADLYCGIGDGDPNGREQERFRIG